MKKCQGRIGVILAAGILLLSGNLKADGNLELSVHYSYWTLNVVRGLVENMVSDALESDLKDRFVQEIQKEYPNLEEYGYNQNVTFDAPGQNIGVELRFYPGGRHGAFSLGLAIEQTTMKISFPEIAANLTMKDTNLNETADFQAVAHGEFVVKPLSFHLNMRWEFLPSKVISPYLCLGAGISTSRSFFDAKYSYDYNGTLTLPDNTKEQYSESATKTLGEIRDERQKEGKDFPINFMPIVQFNLGLRARLSRFISLNLDAGIFNGFIFRGGLAVRI